ncbi:MAG: NUDIX hydrolase [Bdellovibrionales bacterium]
MSKTEKKSRDITNLTLICGDEVLLAVRSGNDAIDHPYSWAAPGGSVERDEDLVAATRREFAEEVLGKASSAYIEQVMPFALEKVSSVTREDGRRIHSFVAHISEEEKLALIIYPNWENLAVKWVPVDRLPPVDRFHPDYVETLNGILLENKLTDTPVGQREVDKVPEGHTRRYHGSGNIIPKAELGYIYSSIGHDADGAGFYSADIETVAGYVPTDGNIGGWIHTVDMAFTEEECITDVAKPLTEEQKNKLDTVFQVEGISEELPKTDIALRSFLEKSRGAEKAREILYMVGIKGYMGGDGLCLAFHPEDVKIRHIEEITAPPSALTLVQEYQSNKLRYLTMDIDALYEKADQKEKRLVTLDELSSGLGRIVPRPQHRRSRHYNTIKKRPPSRQPCLDEAVQTVQGLVTALSDIDAHTDDLRSRANELFELTGYTSGDRSDYGYREALLRKEIEGSSWGRFWNTKKYQDLVSKHKGMIDGFKKHYVPELDTDWRESAEENRRDVFAKTAPSFSNPKVQQIFGLAKEVIAEKYRTSRVYADKVEERYLPYDEESLKFRELCTQILGKEFKQKVYDYDAEVLRKNVGGNASTILSQCDDPQSVSYEVWQAGNRRGSDARKNMSATANFLAAHASFDQAMDLLAVSDKHCLSLEPLISLCEAFPDQATKHKEIISKRLGESIYFGKYNERIALKEFTDREVVVKEALAQYAAFRELPVEIFALDKQVRRDLVLDSEIIKAVSSSISPLWSAQGLGRISKEYYAETMLSMAEALSDLSPSEDHVEKYNDAANRVREEIVDRKFVKGLPPDRYQRLLDVSSRLQKNMEKTIKREREHVQEERGILLHTIKQKQQERSELVEYRRKYGGYPLEDVSMHEFADSFDTAYRRRCGGRDKAFSPFDRCDQLAKAWCEVHPDADYKKTAQGFEELSKPRVEKLFHAPFPDDLSDLKFLSNLEGSTRPSLMLDEATGEKYVVKTGKSNEHAENEYKANRIYAAFGLDVPDARLYTKPDGVKAVALRFIHGKDQGYIESGLLGNQIHAFRQEIGRGFVVDALLDNWDVVANGQNIRVGTHDNRNYRIDVGGSMTTRAQGEAREWSGQDIRSIDSLREAKHALSQKVYGRLSYPEIAQQILDAQERLPNVEALVKDGVITQQEYGVIESRLSKISERYSPVVDTYKVAKENKRVPVWFTAISKVKSAVAARVKVQPKRAPALCC